MEEVEAGGLQAEVAVKTRVGMLLVSDRSTRSRDKLL